MAFAAVNLSTNIAGYFTEKDYGRPFEYKNNPDKPMRVDMKTGKNAVYPHLVFVGPAGDQMREALVKKTVAYVVIEELDCDRYLVEKWNIKKHRAYSR